MDLIKHDRLDIFRSQKVFSWDHATAGDERLQSRDMLVIAAIDEQPQQWSAIPWSWGPNPRRLTISAPLPPELCQVRGRPRHKSRHPTPANVDQHHQAFPQATGVPTIKALAGVLPAALHLQTPLQHQHDPKGALAGRADLQDSRPPVRGRFIPPAAATFVGNSVTHTEAARAAHTMSIGYTNKPRKTAKLTTADTDTVISTPATLTEQIT